MKRGTVWSVSAGGPIGKPRPAVILRDDRYSDIDTVTVCPISTTAVDATDLRIRLDPSFRNGLRAISYAMTDKVTTLPHSKIGALIGTLNPGDMERIERGVMLYLGLANTG